MYSSNHNLWIQFLRPNLTGILGKGDCEDTEDEPLLADDGVADLSLLVTDEGVTNTGTGELNTSSSISSGTGFSSGRLTSSRTTFPLSILY